MRLSWRRSARIPEQATIDAGYTAPNSASADAVRVAHDQILSITQPGGGTAGYLGLRSPAQAVEVLITLGRLAGDLEPVLNQVDRYLRREDTAGRLTADEGPFTGDPSAAVGTTHMWLSEAAIAADKLRKSLENAQIAAGGLARPAEPERP